MLLPFLNVTLAFLTFNSTAVLFSIAFRAAIFSATGSDSGAGAYVVVSASASSMIAVMVLMRAWAATSYTTFVELPSHSAGSVFSTPLNVLLAELLLPFLPLSNVKARLLRDLPSGTSKVTLLPYMRSCGLPPEFQMRLTLFPLVNG